MITRLCTWIVVRALSRSPAARNAVVHCVEQARARAGGAPGSFLLQIEVPMRGQVPPKATPPPDPMAAYTRAAAQATQATAVREEW